MSEQTETTQANGTSTSLIEANESIMSDQTAINKTLASLDKLTPGINLAPQYMEFDKEGQTLRGVFVGFIDMEITDTATGEYKTLNCAAIMDAEQNLCVNGGVSLTGAFRSSKTPMYTPVEITYQGQKKVKSGLMKQYAVRPLAQPQ